MGQPYNEANLSALCGRFKIGKKVLLAFPEHLKCTPIKGKNEELVRLVGAGGGISDGGGRGGGKTQKSSKSSGAAHGKGDANESGGKSRGKKGGWGGAAMS